MQHIQHLDFQFSPHTFDMLRYTYLQASTVAYSYCKFLCSVCGGSKHSSCHEKRLKVFFYLFFISMNSNVTSSCSLLLWLVVAFLWCTIQKRYLRTVKIKSQLCITFMLRNLITFLFDNLYFQYLFKNMSHRKHVLPYNEVCEHNIRYTYMWLCRHKF